MAEQQQMEFWLRGPIHGIPGYLQPVAHAILQAQLEVNEGLRQFPDPLLWKRPGNAAPVAFHLQHLAGVLDRLFTYARGEQLSDQQLMNLQKEGREDSKITVAQLIDHFNLQVGKSLVQLKNTSPSSLSDTRDVGRKKIPSTVLGLLFHAAEHTQRHNGQLLVTVKVLLNN
jgi:hypothetical protein